MSNIQKDGPRPICQCRPGCTTPVGRNRWGWTKYAHGHKPKTEKTLMPRKPHEHTDDSRPSLPIREVSREEFDAMAKASDSTYKAPETSRETRIQTTPFPQKFPTYYKAEEEVSSEEALPPAVMTWTIDGPKHSALFIVATSLAAFLAGLIIGKKRTK